MTRNDTLLLVITGGVSGQLKDLSGEVFKYSSKVDCILRVSVTEDGESCLRTRCTSTNTLGIVTLLQETVDTTNWELKAGFGRTRLLGFAFSGRGLSRLGLSSSLAGHSRYLCSGYKDKAGAEGLQWWWLLVKGRFRVSAWEY